MGHEPLYTEPTAKTEGAPRITINRQVDRAPAIPTQRWQQWGWRPAVLALLGLVLLAVLLGGCSGRRGGIDFDRVVVALKPMDYARVLCRPTPMEHRHTCLSAVLEHFQETWDQTEPRGQQTVGRPLLIILDNEIYQGSYRVTPVSGTFSARGASNTCRGRYSALAGDREAIFQVVCDDGARGQANLILGQDGQNGLGRLWLDHGREGDIVFGHRAVGSLQQTLAAY
ncbi:MAG: hypothetical protein EA400_04330 [Chromatiaceae bacterium]|nr:MAG: hypothetical protein EA400_04330 [Chromatiaceae bacterium]